MNRIEKKTLLKICVICGDKANGYNFNAISCESCKAFFRRNALRKKVFKCIFNNKCDITVISRKFCQKCRLQKCFNQGMNKGLILTEEEKRLMKNKTQENKQNRKTCLKENVIDVTNSCKNQLSSTSNEQTMSNSENDLFVNKFLFSYQQDQSLINKPSQIYCENNMTSMKSGDQGYHYSERSEHFDKCFLLRNFEQIFYRETKPNERSINTIAGLLASEDSLQECGTQKTFLFSANRGLNLLEQNRINELNSAFLQVENLSVNIPECVKHPDLLRHIEISVRLLIKRMKRIECFTSLCPSDQIALLKAGCTQICILRSISRYNSEEQTWTINKGGKFERVVTMDVFKQSSTSTMYETHKQFMKILSEEWQSDMIVLNLLSMIVLFNANRPDIIHKPLIA